MDKLISALCKAQTNMGKAHKDRTNPHFKSRYATLDSVISAAVPALNEHGIYYYAIQHENCIRTILAMGSDQIHCDVPLMLPDRCGMQQLGSAITYAKRYGLALITGLSVDEDDDGNKAQETPREEAQGTSKEIQAPPTPNELYDAAAVRIAGITDAKALAKATLWAEKQTAPGQPLERFKAAMTQCLVDAAGKLKGENADE